MRCGSAMRTRDECCGPSSSPGTEEEEPFSRLAFSPDGRTGRCLDGRYGRRLGRGRLVVVPHAQADPDRAHRGGPRRRLQPRRPPRDHCRRRRDRETLGPRDRGRDPGAPRRAPVAAAAFMPDGLRILAAGWDGIVTVWDARPVRWIPGRGEVYKPE